jgi:hypothetical protein
MAVDGRVMYKGNSANAVVYLLSYKCTGIQIPDKIQALIRACKVVCKLDRRQ